ncbi:hypothetical protein ACIRUY_25720 [Streptomyces erythrochromogenes]|uniref:hypothetical protein n=1 Tax=Streptomyces erythrochromogenes TaxID=285574 RepID=UPI003818E954
MGAAGAYGVAADTADGAPAAATAAVGVAVAETGSDGAAEGTDEDEGEAGADEDAGGAAALGSPPPPFAHPEAPASRTTATAATHRPPW